MYKSFSVILGVASAISLESATQYPEEYGPEYTMEYLPEYQPEYYPDELVDYSTSYKGVGRLSKNLKDYKPSKIRREYTPEEEARIPQYRSVKWGNEGPYYSWREIDPLDQPAAYEKPSYVQTLISPDIVVNQYDNMPFRGTYGGVGGVQRRSEGVNYGKRVYNHTPSNGYRRNTKTTEYEHTDQSYTDTYRRPKPFQTYKPRKEEKKVEPVKAGVVKIGEQAPLEYPEYISTTYEFEKPVMQKYHVTESQTVTPGYVEYEGPHHEFLEYELLDHSKVLPTYYEPGERVGEKTWGYVPEPDYIEEVPVDWYYKPPYYKEPVTHDLYPMYYDQTYSEQTYAHTDLPAPEIYEDVFEADLYPRFEDVHYDEPRYREAEPKEQGYRKDYHVTTPIGKSKVTPMEQRVVYQKPEYVF